MEEIQMIRPSNMQFHYQYPLDDYTCYRLHTGTCSLELPFDNSVKAPREHPYYQQKEACQSLFACVEHGDAPPVEIIKYDCGHYGFTDGQHRVCIAQKKDLEIPAMIQVGRPVCCSCVQTYNLSSNESLRHKIARLFKAILPSY